MTTYYKLLDKLNYEEVVKKEALNEEYQYSFGEEKWYRSSIMLFYRWADNDEFGQYEEITEKEAEHILDKQRERYNDLLELAVKVATEAHKGQTDKGGNPYIEHPKAVAAQLNNIEHKIVAYLHDVCEDTHITLDDLSEMGFTYRIVNSVRLLTKTNTLTYKEYLKRLKADDSARYVKIADLKHNMDISRIHEPTEKDYRRLEKYKKTLAFLESSQTDL